MIQEQLILSKIVTLFALVEISLLHNVLGYRIDAYFPKHKLAIEVDEQGHNDRDFNLEIEWQKAIEKNLVVNSLELIQLKRTLIFFVEISKIQNYMAMSIRKIKMQKR